MKVLRCGLFVITRNADLLCTAQTKLLSGQRLGALCACEAVSVVKLVVISDELDAAFDEALAAVAALCVLLAVARLAHGFASLLGERFSGQRLAAVRACEAGRVECVPVMLHGRGRDDFIAFEARLKCQEAAAVSSAALHKGQRRELVARSAVV